MPTKRREPEVELHFEHQDGFKPNAKIYKGMCCHVKTMTIFVAIGEIFFTCFMLVAVLPDVTSRICERLNETDVDLIDAIQNFELRDFRNATLMNNILCSNHVSFLLWALCQVVAALCLFYGIKSQRWQMFIPHFVIRIALFAVIGAIEVWLMYRAIGDEEDRAGYITTMAIIAGIFLFLIYASYKELRTCHFLKRSRETGFSISVARAVGPATISLSDAQPAPPQEIRRLPPLRHIKTRDNQYVVEGFEPEAPGNPNAINA